jgi:hypothetical protein
MHAIPPEEIVTVTGDQQTTQEPDDHKAVQIWCQTVLQLPSDTNPDNLAQP